MKKMVLVCAGIGLFSMAPQAVQAGVRVDFRVGFPDHGRGRHCRPVFCEPVCRPRIIYTSSCWPRPRRVVYVESDPVVVVREPSYVQETVYSSPAREPVNEEPTFTRLGHDWAKDLRDDVATRDQFIAYLKANISKSSTADYSDFRRGFIAAYGVNGEAAFDKAYQEARGN